MYLEPTLNYIYGIVNLVLQPWAEENLHCEWIKELNLKIPKKKMIPRSTKIYES